MPHQGSAKAHFPDLVFRDRVHGRPVTIRVLSANAWALLPPAERANWGIDESTGARLTISLDRPDKGST